MAGNIYRTMTLSTFCGQVLLEVCFGLINSCRHFAQFLPETESGTGNFQRLTFRGENMLRLPLRSVT